MRLGWSLKKDQENGFLRKTNLNFQFLFFYMIVPSFQCGILNIIKLAL